MEDLVQRGEWNIGRVPSSEPGNLLGPEPSSLPYLVGGLEHFLFFPILGIIIPTDFHIFQRGRYTTSQIFV